MNEWTRTLYDTGMTEFSLAEFAITEAHYSGGDDGGTATLVLRGKGRKPTVTLKCFGVSLESGLGSFWEWQHERGRVVVILFNMQGVVRAAPYGVLVELPRMHEIDWCAKSVTIEVTE